MQASFQYKNSNISYRKEGSGQTIVLLHGFGEDSEIWNEQLPALATKYQVIIPELPGTGKSQMLESAGGAPVSIDDYAACIYALAQHEKLKTFTLLGHSMGGYITLAFADKYSELLNGFGLLHSTAFADNDEKKASRKKGIELMLKYGGYSFLKGTTPNLFSDKYKQEQPDRVAALVEKGKAFSTEVLVQYYEAMLSRPDRTLVLKTSKVPVLFIIGSADVAAPLDDLLQQVHLPAISHIHILEGVGHIGLWEATTTVNKHLLAFMDGLSETAL